MMLTSFKRGISRGTVEVFLKIKKEKENLFMHHLFNEIAN